MHCKFLVFFAYCFLFLFVFSRALVNSGLSKGIGAHGKQNPNFIIIMIKTVPQTVVCILEWQLTNEST